MISATKIIQHQQRVQLEGLGEGSAAASLIASSVLGAVGTGVIIALVMRSYKQHDDSPARAGLTAALASLIMSLVGGGIALASTRY